MANDERVSFYVSAEALALLRKLDYPCSEDVLASATLTDEGYQLTGDVGELEQLAGFVAGDANHEDRRKRKKIALLEQISEELESALSGTSAGLW